MAKRQQRRRNNPRPIQTQGIFPQLLVVQGVQLIDPSHALVSFGAELVFSGIPGWQFSGHLLTDIPILQMDGSYLCTFAGAIVGAASFATAAWDLNARGSNGAWISPGSIPFNVPNPLLEQMVIGAASRSESQHLAVTMDKNLGSLSVPTSWNLGSVGNPVGIWLVGGYTFMLEFASDFSAGDVLYIPPATTEVVSDAGWPCAPVQYRIT